MFLTAFSPFALADSFFEGELNTGRFSRTVSYRLSETTIRSFGQSLWLQQATRSPRSFSPVNMRIALMLRGTIQKQETETPLSRGVPCKISAGVALGQSTLLTFEPFERLALPERALPPQSDPCELGPEPQASHISFGFRERLLRNGPHHRVGPFV